MIALQRPAEVPSTLHTKGRAARAELEREFLAHETDYQSGARKLPIARTIYAASDVKQTLIAMQHHKCAFCEAKITHIDDGDVEHFRPKRAWKQHRGDSLQRPGYYWLAYEWSNLLLSCTKCNARHKGNLFPIVDPTARARDHRDDITVEQPIFLDPAHENPAQHIAFDRWDVTPAQGSTRGRDTIRELGLQRPELCEHRRDRYVFLKTLNDLVEVVLAHSAVTLQPDQAVQIEKARTLLSRATQPEAEYSAMARSLLVPAPPPATSAEPESTGPESTGPESTGPESTGPESTGPESTGRGDAGFERG